jgi:trans-aconitate methyltransferase
MHGTCTFVCLAVGMIDSRSRPDPIAYLDQVAASSPGRAYKRQVLDLLDLRSGQRVLDLGCGPGRTSPRWPTSSGRTAWSSGSTGIR